MPITTVLVPPNRNMSPDVFSDTADEWTGDLVAWTGEVNQTAEDVNADAVTSSEAASDAVNSKNAAVLAQQAAETAAQSAAGIASAPMWVAGNYAFGDYVWSPLSLLTYRRLTPGTTASATDPRDDPTGWKLVGSVSTMPQNTLTGLGPHQLQTGFHYLVMTPLAVLVMPPSTTAPQEKLRITDQTGATGVTIQRNGGTFRTYAVDLIVDSVGWDRELVQTSTQGWV